MQDNEAPPPEAAPSRFHCYVKTQVEGPFDIVELAAQLRYATIDGDTPISREGSEEWFPFRDLPEFAIAQQLPIETIARHLEEKERTGLSPRLPDEPSPSRQNFLPIIAIALFCVVALGIFLVQHAHTLASWLPFGPQKPVDFVFAKQYRAEVEVTAGPRHENEVIYMDNGKNRTERAPGGITDFTIIRPDTNKIYGVMPDKMAYYEKTLAPEGMDLSTIGIPVNYMRMGPEMMNGIACIKYIVTVNGSPYYLWADTARQVPVRTTTWDGNGITEYKSYQPGPQDPTLFEPPPNYHQRETDSDLLRLVPATQTH